MLGPLTNFVKNIVTKPFKSSSANNGADPSAKSDSRGSAEKLAETDSFVTASTKDVGNNPGIWVPVTAEFKDFNANDKKSSYRSIIVGEFCVHISKISYQLSIIKACYSVI